MEGRERDLRVPLISTLFCIFVLTGGVFLVIYVFMPDYSQPWFPEAALTLIGSPWLFWILTYIYTCIKRCCCYGNEDGRLDNRQISRRSSKAAAPTPPMANNDVGAPHSPNIDNDGRHSMENGHSHQGGEDGSINSSKEIEMPLTLSVAS